MELKGTIEGDVKLKGHLVIAAGGKVTGDISATSVVVDGEVFGNLEAKGKVQLNRNAKMKGDLLAKSLTIQEGAAFAGRVSEEPPHGDGFASRETPKPDYEPVYN
jgi:cytoskeletal protein CcmA (bactofilin family)